ncbi:MAG: hypothetical protein ACYS1C_03120 [Planctomycetota bacterium]
MQTQSGKAAGVRRGTALLIGVAALAALPRVVVLGGILHDLPYHRTTIEGFDQHTYNVWAQQIAAGDWLSSQEGVFYFTPLYPYLLAGVYLVAGSGNAPAGIVLNAAFGVAAAVCAAGLGRRLFGWWGGLVAGLLMALAASQIAWESVLLVDCLLTALLLGALWLIVELLPRERAAPRPSPALYLLPGLLLGLATVGRGSNLLPAAALGCFAATVLFRTERRRAALVAATLAAGLCLAVAPFVVRNGLMYGRWMLTTNGPVTIYLGNYPGTPGFYAEASRALDGSHALRDGDYWQGKLMGELKRKPLSLAPTMLNKVLLFFNAWDVADNGNYHFLRRYVTSLRVLTFGPLFLLVIGVLGVARTVDRWRELMALYVFAASFAASIIVVLVAGRYKLPFYGVMAVFGGGAAVELARDVGRRRLAALSASAALALLLTFAFWPRSYAEEFRRLCPLRTVEFRNNAAALVRHERLREAVAMLDDGAQLFPSDTKFTETLADMHLSTDRPDLALAAANRALSRGVASKLILEQRAVALWRLGLPGEARREAERIIRRFPDSDAARRILSLTGG